MIRAAPRALLDEGTLSFTIESRILRELGERLVKQPEVAVLELIKNAYDADATKCEIGYGSTSISVEDDGSGMTLEQFSKGWMRIGTSSKEDTTTSPKFQRRITGEKGIGRFAVRFLGRTLRLESVADDPKRNIRTRLVADFDWPLFDQHEDLGKIRVPYRLEAVDRGSAETGTTLVITDLRPGAERLDLKKLRTGSMGVLSPLSSLFREATGGGTSTSDDEGVDPGFVLIIAEDGTQTETETDVAADILKAFVLRARLRLKGSRLTLSIYKRDDKRPYLKIIDTYPNSLQRLYADIRFFPRRKGAFTGLPVDGRLAHTWVMDNSGVAVFDRNFRVQPYGLPGDDWLQLSADNARNYRVPRSTIANKHYPMSQQVRVSTSENWMLRLPQPAQLVGLVQVEGRRTNEQREEGLVASADREGFVENEAFRELTDLVRGAVEMIAFADKSIQQEEERRSREALLASIRAETRAAISDVQENPNIAPADKDRIVSAIAQTQTLVEKHEESAREREQQLEVMSLLGVVAGFMTHEFGVALQELEDTYKALVNLAKTEPRFKKTTEAFAAHIRQLREFVTYASGYIQGAKTKPSKPYPARPRLLQVKRIFGRYAEERNIKVEIAVEPDVLAPLVPASLYNGIALNLYTNALKAVTAKVGDDTGTIAFRAWNDARWHHLEVSDTGVGIPSVLHERIFDPLFTTTESRNDPLGSGMGLGLALVKRGTEAFGGRVELVPPPPGFATCVRIRLPIKTS